MLYIQGYAKYARTILGFLLVLDVFHIRFKPVKLIIVYIVIQMEDVKNAKQVIKYLQILQLINVLQYLVHHRSQIVFNVKTQLFVPNASSDTTRAQMDLSVYIKLSDVQFQIV